MSLPRDPRSRLATLRTRLSARAAGAWVVRGDRLEQLAFEPAPDLPAEVADRFASATRSVDLARVELGIARAASTGRPVVSVATDLPADVGSGHWLRAFGAARSIAVPVVGPAEGVALVVSVALGPEPDADAVEAEIIREFGSAEG